MGQVSVREARDKLSQLIKDAQAGEDVVIASHGRPVARIVPIRSIEGPDLVRWIRKNQIPADVARTKEEVDRYLEAERASWE
jgi:prevent-host-death family protein